MTGNRLIRDMSGVPIPPTEEEIRALADCPERIAQLRQRRCSLSWFMGRLNEFIARAADKEDRVKGRFWESRFHARRGWSPRVADEGPGLQA